MSSFPIVFDLIMLFAMLHRIVVLFLSKIVKNTVLLLLVAGWLGPWLYIIGDHRDLKSL